MTIKVRFKIVFIYQVAYINCNIYIFFQNQNLGKEFYPIEKQLKWQLQSHSSQA